MELIDKRSKKIPAGWQLQISYWRDDWVVFLIDDNYDRLDFHTNTDETDPIDAQIEDALDFAERECG